MARVRDARGHAMQCSFLSPLCQATVTFDQGQGHWNEHEHNYMPSISLPPSEVWMPYHTYRRKHGKMAQVGGFQHFRSKNGFHNKNVIIVITWESFHYLLRKAFFYSGITHLIFSIYAFGQSKKQLYSKNRSGIICWLMQLNSHPEMTSAVEWALKANYLCICSWIHEWLFNNNNETLVKREPTAQNPSLARCTENN